MREQVSRLTGQRFLEGYADDEAQYRALMNAGLTYAEQWQLRPGVALSAEQMAQLTSDIVWLVEQPVSLPDGSVQQVLVPQLYVRVKPGDLQGDGTLIAADAIDLKLTGDLTNSGTIAGRRVVQLDAENLRNLGGRIAGAEVSAQARTDLDNLGGTIEAARALSATAGRDLQVASTTRTRSYAHGRATYLDRVAGLYVSDPGGSLTATAGRDASFIAAEIVKRGAAARPRWRPGATSRSAPSPKAASTPSPGTQPLAPRCGEP